MGIFSNILNFFKKENTEEQLRTTYEEKLESITEPPRFVPMQPPRKTKYISKIQNTVYYVDGYISKISPEPIGRYYDNRDTVYGATYIVSDGVPYDLSDINSVLSMKIPDFNDVQQTKMADEMGVTGSLAYTLRSRACQFHNEEEFDLAIACLSKATVFMKYSEYSFKKEEFYRIVNWLMQLGRFTKAKEWQDWIEQATPSGEDEQDYIWEKTKSVCNMLKTDLVEVGDLRACCEICAMYRRRIYSLTGKDKRFPKFPKDFHEGCGLAAFPFVWGLDDPNFECKDVIAYSNRPFIDDRTPEELKNREERLKKIEKQNLIYPVSITKITYYWLKQLFPEDVPKSLSAFSRAKNANTAKYQALVKKAEAAGFVFPESLEDVAKWEDNPPLGP